jgi:predicted transcriptional regulator
LNSGDTPRPEAAGRRRLAWEAEKIAEARVELDAGLYVDAADVETWIDSLGTDHDMPLPATRRR